MKMRVLGCSGGISLGFHTSSYLLDESILIDAGTGVGQLTLDEMQKIDHIFITHPHMDHIACLPLLLDTTITSRTTPVTIWGTKTTVEALQKYIFNYTIWPDFSVIPTPESPFMQYRIIEAFETITLANGHYTVVPMNHSVPTIGFLLESLTGQRFMLCGDTSVQEDFWHYINQVSDLKGLAIEAAFSDVETRLADLSKHLSPNRLVDELTKLNADVPIYVMHLKPGQTEVIIRELILHKSTHQISLLFNNQVFEF
jgi:cAMP phosphodiesterase